MNLPSAFRLKPLTRVAALTTAGAILVLPHTAHAEAPMNTDDAGTMTKGGKKIETNWAASEGEIGGELVFGLSPVDNLELEIVASHADDDADNAETDFDGLGIGAKWVPYQNDIGWSLGARLDFGHSEVNEHAAGLTYNEQEIAVTGLASYRLANGHALHLNLGAAQTKSQGERGTFGTWSIGYELPLLDRLQLTMETYGQEHASASKAVGLRHEVFEGLKISGAIGYGNGKSFGQVGAAWEF